MHKQEVAEMATALERIAPSISVCDIPSRKKDENGKLCGKRVLCAMLPAGMKFKSSGFSVLEVPYRPGDGREEFAKRELLRQAGLGVTGAEGGHSRRGRYDATRYLNRIVRGRLAHG